jgi:hypothetical protein
MGKISAEAKAQYSQRVKAYKQDIEGILQREKNILSVVQKDESGAAYKRLTLADERMNLASYHLLLNRISVALLGIKNESFLNDARKSCYQSIIYLEEVVSGATDVPFSDYEERLEQIEGFDEAARFQLVRKLGFTIHAVRDAFGDNTKWKWSFVELEGRLSTVAKNLIDLKALVAGLDPRADHYEARLGHLTLTKELLQHAADRYREKYELSTARMDDFKQAIAYLGALRRIHMILSEATQAEVIKKKMDVWRAKMEDDEKRNSGRPRRSAESA